jgi:hypothetical protein
LRTDWWGKYTSGILIETYIRSMELFSIVLWSILHGWMEEYNSWFFSWLFGNLHSTICSTVYYLSQSLPMFCELEGNILFIFLTALRWYAILLQINPVIFWNRLDQMLSNLFWKGNMVESRNKYILSRLELLATISHMNLMWNTISTPKVKTFQSPITNMLRKSGRNQHEPSYLWYCF